MADLPSISSFTAAGLGEAEARALVEQLQPVLETSGEARWRAAVPLLSPSVPFPVHELLYGWAWEDQPGPGPAWLPTAEDVAATNVGPDGFEEVWRRSVAEPSAFWAEQAERMGVRFSTRPWAVLDVDGGPELARWFPGGRTNIAECALLRLAPDATAVLRQTEDGPLERIPAKRLRADAAAVAAGLAAAGLDVGDAIAIDMPMTYESVAIYLGIVLLGGAVVSIADSFAAPEIATRLRIAEAKAVFTQDVIVRGGRTLPLYERVVAAEAPRAIVLPGGSAPLPSLRPGDLSWQAFLDGGGGCVVEPVQGDMEDVTNILFSSGTTGEPKAIPWTQITPIKAAADGWAHQDIREGDVVAWPTNLGWMMGPWLIYASLLNGAAIALYEGLPSGPGFCRFVQDAGVTMLGVVPSLVRAWQATGATDGVDWSALRCFSSTGEASNPSEYLWLMSRAGYRPVVEYCGGTEIGGGYICGAVAQPQAPGTFSTPAIGTQLVLLDNESSEDEGEVALIPPMLGSSNRLLNRDHHEVYFAGMPPGPDGEVLRRHGDWIQCLPDGRWRAQGRVDDTMNLGGIKTSSAEIERACATVEGVVETAAIAVSPPDGGPSELVLYVVYDGEAPAALQRDLQRAIRSSLNPLFKVAQTQIVAALPRTASGKVMRRVLRSQHAAG